MKQPMAYDKNSPMTGRKTVAWPWPNSVPKSLTAAVMNTANHRSSARLSRSVGNKRPVPSLHILELDESEKGLD
jgi:hypothetical protein